MTVYVVVYPSGWDRLGDVVLDVKVFSDFQIATEFEALNNGSLFTREVRDA